MLIDSKISLIEYSYTPWLKTNPVTDKFLEGDGEAISITELSVSLSTARRTRWAGRNLADHLQEREE